MALLYAGWMLKPLLSLTVLIALLVFGATAATPTVTGPITAAAPAGDPSHQYPFFAALEDLKGRGYIDPGKSPGIRTWTRSSQRVRVH